MDLAKDILDVAEKVGTAPGLTIASSIVTSILKTVETSKNNTVRLKTLAHSLASQLIDISENMKGKWDDAPLTLKRVIDEYDAFLIEMLKSITRLSQYSRLRALFLAGECEREINRLEKRVADVRSTVIMMIGMNLSVTMHQVQTSLASHGQVVREVHSGVQRLTEGVRLLDLEPDSSQTTPDFSIFTRGDFQVTKTVSRQSIHDRQLRDVMTVTIHRAERCSDGRALLVKTFEGSDTLRVRRRELEILRKALNPALLQIIGWSSSAAQIPFHVYHTPGGIIETFFSWAQRTLRSNPVETVFGLYDMRNSVKELVELERNQRLGFRPLFHEAVVNIQQCGDRPRFSLIYAGIIEKDNYWDKEYPPAYYRDYWILRHHDQWQSGYSTHDVPPVVNLISLFAGGVKTWFGDVHGIEALFKEHYDTIDPLHLGPALLKAGWLGPSPMHLEFEESVRLGDVGYLAQDGHFEVVANLHATLVSRTGGCPAWIYETFPISDEINREDANEYALVSHSETLYRRYRHVFTPQDTFSKICHNRHRRLEYTNLDEGCAWATLQQEAFCIIERNHLSIAPQELQLVISIADYSGFHFGRRHSWMEMVEPTAPEEFPPDPTSITVYEFEREEFHRVLDSGVPELNIQVFWSFQENIDRLDPTEIQQHPERGDILMRQDPKFVRGITYLQLPLGVTRPSASGIEEIPD